MTNSQVPTPNEKLQEKNVDVLIAEYHACQENRSHYDSIRWVIGSIFIGASLALFGLSFQVTDLVSIRLMGCFSSRIFLFGFYSLFMLIRLQICL